MYAWRFVVGTCSFFIEIYQRAEIFWTSITNHRSLIYQKNGWETTNTISWKQTTVSGYSTMSSNPLNKQFFVQEWTNCLNSVKFNIYIPRCSRRFFNRKVMYLRVHSAESLKYWSEFARKWTPCSVKENGVWSTPTPKVQLCINSLSTHLQQKTRYNKYYGRSHNFFSFVNYPHSIRCTAKVFN